MCGTQPAAWLNSSMNFRTFGRRCSERRREKSLDGSARWAETATGAEGSAWKERELISGPSAQSFNGVGGIDINGHQSPAHGFIAGCFRDPVFRPTSLIRPVATLGQNSSTAGHAEEIRADFAAFKRVDENALGSACE
jgi:hypothetical protein